MKANFTKFLKVVLIVVMCMSFLVACKENENEKKYQQAYELLESKDYEAAYDLFVELGDYKDAAKEAARFHYAPTNTTIKSYIEGKEEVKSYTTTYNDENLPLQTVTKYASGLVHTCNYTYSDQGQILIIDCIESTGNTEYTEYTYDEKGQLIKYYLKDAYGEDIDEYTYDENGNYKTSKHSTSLGSKYDIEYFYDENNNLIQEKIVSIEEDYTEISIYDYIYDENGYIIEKVYTTNGEIDGGVEYTYDENYNCIKEAYTIIALGMVVEYFYDENNRCIKETMVAPPIMNIEYTMIYDEAGNLIKKFEKNDSGVEHHYEYSYKFVYVPYDMDSKAWEELIKNKLYI